MTAILVIVLCIPFASQAQFVPSDYGYSLNGVLDRLFDEMLPLCNRMMGVGRAIGGFAALSFIAVRVWRHLAKAEPIDFFPLLKPFGIGLAILLFPSVIALMNGVLKPTVEATAAMSQDSKNAILYHIHEEEKAARETPPAGIYPGGNDDTEKYEPGDSNTSSGIFSGLRNAFSWMTMKTVFKLFITELVRILYTAAGLCINTIRTFYLIILAILGPLVLGLSIFDGFSHTLASWFARYINVYMWLPVANIFGAISSKILENMMNLDQGFASSTAYIVFMLISVVGYLTVPNVAGYIIQAGGRDTLLHKITDMTAAAGKAAVGAMV
ncbi:conjugative transposon protein TraJ [Pedobacter sp. KR3-3]|uniref:Conjugative transposon protein TraJ n=1 Tax=Pedobacter albus TaxID=3113905 RepID=A0ABU7IAL3_9SPHI|nr:conjugative transposon protein TraJ [Pedobacter sp. KR3-3]MEE1946402.1 conjugative transposon protein TraJ [Pedobacter sp. KR3-3]